MTWRIRQIPDLTGRRALVTGATGGIGFQVCLELARAGASVVLASRDEVATERAAEGIQAKIPAAVLDVLRIDLTDLTSVRAASEYALNRWPVLDILINNAAVMATPHHVTADGFELQFATNHLGPFAFTGLMLPALQNARVVTVSSLMHHNARSVPDFHMHTERRYRRWMTYSESKLANLMFMLELHRRARHAGLGLLSVAAHPGYTSTRLQVTGPQMDGAGLPEYLLLGFSKVIGQSSAAGALPLLMAATLPTIAGGTYIGPSKMLELRGLPQPVGMSRAARDKQAARRLWVMSEAATGVHYL
jgi:NAD(P)-dependent dehydrogenase (short-subunit alcohol dehydrogenase family)